MTNLARPLTVLDLGGIEIDQFASLSPFFSTVEQITTVMARDADLAAFKGEINRALDSASSRWVVILRQRETISPALAREISDAATEGPRAWGFRIRTELRYCGRHLLLKRQDDGEIRLVHTRHSRFELKKESREMKVEGTVLRLSSPLELATFSSEAEHRAHLSRQRRARSFPFRLARFVVILIANGGAVRSAPTLRYLWIEAGFES
ncbi:MAG TPA: hypothetical protein VNM92_17860 [Thermoanaerobaculia bacterium]|nr:hypothetical protein [Thermoanaerobaculia bacterium]